MPGAFLHLMVNPCLTVTQSNYPTFITGFQELYTMDLTQFCLSLIWKQLRGQCSFISEKKGTRKLKETNITHLDPKRVSIEHRGENKDLFCILSLIEDYFY